MTACLYGAADGCPRTVGFAEIAGSGMVTFDA